MSSSQLTDGSAAALKPSGELVCVCVCVCIVQCYCVQWESCYIENHVLH